MRQELIYEIFVDLHKTYGAMGQGRALAIMEEYGVVPQVYRILTRYWDLATMAERASGYYGYPFQGCQGVTKGYPLSPLDIQCRGRRDRPPLVWDNGG